MYKNSQRKYNINSAYSDPVNSELVKQLQSYIDDEYTDIVRDKPQVGTDAQSPQNDDSVESQPASTTTNRPSPSHFSHSGSQTPGDLPGMTVDDVEDNGNVNESDPIDTPESDITDNDNGSEPGTEPQPDDTNPVEESTILAFTTIEDCSKSSEIIKGTLNVDESTSGVSRVNIKKNNDNKELWIYYEDRVNLNDVMINVVNKLALAGYSYLTFSRLARSDNAMVFDISCISNQIEGIQNEKEET